MEAYRNFVKGKWCDAIDVADFIRHNYTPYTGDESFLAGPTPRTKKLNAVLEGLQKLERENGGVLGIDTDTVSSLLAYPPAYMDKENELIVGLQTGAPLVRGINPFGGIRMARSACEAYGTKMSPKIDEAFRYRTTHNDGVFRVYTDEMRKCRHVGLRPRPHNRRLPPRGAVRRGQAHRSKEKG